MPHEPSPDSSLSSSSSKDNSKNDDGNINNELAEPSNEEMKKEEDFGRFN